MIKTLAAHIFEIDGADAAVRKIQEQPQSQGDLLKNTKDLRRDNMTDWSCYLLIV